MSNRVCIVGIGVVEASESARDMSHKELLYYATKQALNDAGVESSASLDDDANNWVDAVESSASAGDDTSAGLGDSDDSAFDW